jgi:hypothetical protein
LCETIILDMEVKEWYGVKSLYEVQNNTVTSPSHLYEERIVVLRARSFNEAIIEAEKEAKRYAGEESGITYLEYVNVFKLTSEEIQDKTEVFSLMRESELGPDKYIDRYFDTGKERTQL